MLEPIFSTLSFYFNLKTTVCHSLHIKRHGHIFLSFHLLIHFLHHLSIDFISMFFRFKDNKGKPDCLITVCSSHFSESTCFLTTHFLWNKVVTTAFIVFKRAILHPRIPTAFCHFLVFLSFVFWNYKHKSIYIFCHNLFTTFHHNYFTSIMPPTKINRNAILVRRLALFPRVDYGVDFGGV